MTREEIEDRLISLKEKLAGINIKLCKLNNDKSTVRSSIELYEEKLINQLEIDFDDCE
tara:strand:+ start:104 stop:277 length:174 start_codon:yes stop_codon:yes gene_type:complete